MKTKLKEKVTTTPIALFVDLQIGIFISLWMFHAISYLYLMSGCILVTSDPKTHHPTLVACKH